MVQGVSQMEKAKRAQKRQQPEAERSVLVAPVRWLRTSKTMTCQREEGRVWRKGADSFQSYEFTMKGRLHRHLRCQCLSLLKKGAPYCSVPIQDVSIPALHERSRRVARTPGPPTPCSSRSFA